jgi:hypothetical protein
MRRIALIRIFVTLVAVLGAAVIVGCGGSSSSTGARTAAAPRAQWAVSNSEIRELIAEVEPYEVIPGCNPGETTQIELSEVIDGRTHNEPETSSGLEREFRREIEEKGTLLPTREEEEKVCFESQELEIKREADENRELEELEGAEALREEEARESAERRQEEAEEPSTREPPEPTPSQRETQRETDERFAEEGGDGPG